MNKKIKIKILKIIILFFLLLIKMFYLLLHNLDESFQLIVLLKCINQFINLNLGKDYFIKSYGGIFIITNFQINFKKIKINKLN